MKTSILNNTVQEIYSEIEKLNKDEQQALLTQLRAERLLKDNNIIVKEKNEEPLSMAEINDIKHESRHDYAR